MHDAFSVPPTRPPRVPTGPDWLHEVKYDGYRIMVVREEDRVRLIGALDTNGQRWRRRSTQVIVPTCP